jgi:hypothetical protein
MVTYFIKDSSIVARRRLLFEINTDILSKENIITALFEENNYIVKLQNFCTERNIYINWKTFDMPNGFSVISYYIFFILLFHFFLQFCILSAALTFLGKVIFNIYNSDFCAKFKYLILYFAGFVFYYICQSISRVMC